MTIESIAPGDITEPRFVWGVPRRGKGGLVFIYRPTTGDRVFSEFSSEWIKIIKWKNGCRHVIGGTHLVFDAAMSRQYWRGIARRLAAAIVAAKSGVAWDERGTINLIVPVHEAFRAHELMCTAASTHVRGRVTTDANVAALVSSGAAAFDADSLYSIRPVWIDPQYYRVAACTTATYLDWTPKSVVGGLADEEILVADEEAGEEEER